MIRTETEIKGITYAFLPNKDKLAGFGFFKENTHMHEMKSVDYLTDDHVRKIVEIVQKIRRVLTHPPEHNMRVVFLTEKYLIDENLELVPERLKYDRRHNCDNSRKNENIFIRDKMKYNDYIIYR